MDNNAVHADQTNMFDARITRWSRAESHVTSSNIFSPNHLTADLHFSILVLSLDIFTKKNSLITDCVSRLWQSIHNIFIK